MSKWKCKKCGNCCEVIFPIMFGMECPDFDKETRLCKDYENRKELCRTEFLRRKIRGRVDEEKYLIANCKLAKYMKFYLKDCRKQREEALFLIRDLFGLKEV